MLRIALLAAVAFVVLPAASASAGRLLVTGHDADFHCTGNAQCHFVEVATRYVREGAPNPNRRVLVLDQPDLDFNVALDNAFGAGAVPRTVMDPTSPAFAAEPLTVDRYSAILVASDFTCGGCDLNGPSSTPDSDAINARADDIASFFNAGGGLYYNAGASHGNGTPADGEDNFYDAIPIGIQGQPVSPPFCLTDTGKLLGLEDQTCPDPARHNGTRNDINCCATHNSFGDPPAGSVIKVAERDLGNDGVISGDDLPETLIAEGVISGGEIVEPPGPEQPGQPGQPGQPEQPGPPEQRQGKCAGQTVTAGANGERPPRAAIVGTPDSDVLKGTAEADVILGRGGADVIKGKRGDDVICGQRGADEIGGGKDNDTLRGGKAKDRVNGHNGKDGVMGDKGQDQLLGGKANDQLRGGLGVDLLRGRQGNDLLRGRQGNDLLHGGTGDNECHGGGGKDSKLNC